MTEFKFPATLTSGGTVDTLTAYNPDSSTPVYGPINSYHPNFERILAGLRAGDPNVWTLFNVADGVLNAFKQISERYAWDGESILFDGDPQHSTFTELLERVMKSGDLSGLSAIAKFGEKLASNPNLHSREQTYDWLAAHEFQITQDGDVVGYKGLVGGQDDEWRSYASSQEKGRPSGFVNGVPVPELSRIPQKPGDVVTLPRSEVAHDPSQACKRGLHVATKGYAATYGTVHFVYVNPRDIVSVPTDGGGEKVRACRYVLGPQATVETAGPVLRETTTVNAWQGDVGYKV